METILVTGGAGLVGSHCGVELIDSGYDVIVIDNLHNSVADETGFPISLKRIQNLTGKKVHFYHGDIRNFADLKKVFDLHNVNCVLHCAALKRNAESTEKPLEYYEVNAGGTINLLQAMEENNVTNFVFSGSCTVYGNPKYLPVDENHPVGLDCTTPYAWSKFMAEQILRDTCKSQKNFKAISLRYFNPVGAHCSGMIGEDPNGIPNNLTPYIAKVAIGQLPEVSVNGANWNTPDGTGVRDYINVVDLAQGHVNAIEKLETNEFRGFKAYNLSLGKPYSVLDVISAFSKACSQKISYKIAPRRPGDIAKIYGSAELARKELRWQPTKDIDKMCEDLWRFYSLNPNGYSTASRAYA